MTFKYATFQIVLIWWKSMKSFRLEMLRPRTFNLISNRRIIYSGKSEPFLTNRFLFSANRPRAAPLLRFVRQSKMLPSSAPVWLRFGAKPPCDADVDSRHAKGALDREAQSGVFALSIEGCCSAYRITSHRFPELGFVPVF